MLGRHAAASLRPAQPAAARRSNDRIGRRLEATMNVLLWVLEILAALMYGASGVMKVFMFDKISQDVPSFGALSRGVWKSLGVVELVCVVGLIVPTAVP